MTSRKLFSSFFLWLLVFFGNLIYSAFAKTEPTDVEALLKLKNAFHRPLAMHNWLGSDPCILKWFGVECDDEFPQNVIKLHLNSMRLYGSIPYAIGEFKELVSLEMSINGINGSIPSSIGRLSKLEILDLSLNYLEGGIPKELQKLTNLQQLRIQENNIKGVIPQTLSDLKVLDYDKDKVCLASAPGCNQNSNQNDTFVTVPDFAYEPDSVPNCGSNALISGAGPCLGTGNVSYPTSNSASSPGFAPVSPANLEICPLVNVENAWRCLCEGGAVGNRHCSPGVKWSTPCICNSTCPPCNEGQLLSSESCSCVYPLPIRVHINNADFNAFTPTKETNFINGFSSLAGVSASQVIVAHRVQGSVVLDIRIIPFQGAYMSESEVQMINSNLNNQNGNLSDPSLGPFSVSFEPYTTKKDEKSSSHSKVKTLLVVSIAFFVIAALVGTFSSAYVYRSWLIFKSNNKYCTDEDYPHSSCLFYPLENKLALKPQYNTSYPSKPLAQAIVSGVSPMLSKRVSEIGTTRFDFFELQQLTDCFSSQYLIARGGSSSVYKATLPDGQTVAIKQIDNHKEALADKEFLQEAEILARLHHFHLVTLLGCCLEEGVRILVYEYIPNGTLREHLDCKTREEGQKRRLSWDSRLCIALGAARGLEYLHESAHPRVLHRDFKSSNILLDHKLRAKVADFGLAKPLLEDDRSSCSNSTTDFLGTFGYLAPEYVNTGKASKKTDVYSFGVVLLELITGKSPIDDSFGERYHGIVNWAMSKILVGNVLSSDLVDPLLDGFYPQEGMLKLILLSKKCVESNPSERPNMSSIVQALITLLPEHRKTNFKSKLVQVNDNTDKYFETSVLSECSKASYYSTSQVKADRSSGVNSLNTFFSANDKESLSSSWESVNK